MSEDTHWQCSTKVESVRDNTVIYLMKSLWKQLNFKYTVSAEITHTQYFKLLILSLRIALWIKLLHFKNLHFFPQDIAVVLFNSFIIRLTHPGWRCFTYFVAQSYHLISCWRVPYGTCSSCFLWDKGEYFYLSCSKLWCMIPKKSFKHNCVILFMRRDE